MKHKLEHIRTWLTVASLPLGVYIAYMVTVK